MSEEVVKEETEKEVPLEVKIISEKEKPEPSFDYDNYLPDEKEILETEKEIHEINTKRQVKNG